MRSAILLVRLTLPLHLAGGGARVTGTAVAHKTGTDGTRDGKTAAKAAWDHWTARK